MPKKNENNHNEKDKDFTKEENQLTKRISSEFNQANTSINLEQYTTNILNSEFEKENKILREKNEILLEENHKLQTDLAIMELTNRKNEEKIEYFFQENLKLRNLMEKFEEMQMKIDIYEKMDFKGLIQNSKSQDQIISAFLDKIKIIEADYGNEIIELKRIITHLKLQVDQVNNLEESFREKVGNSVDMKSGDFELLETREKLIKTQEENLTLKQDVGKLIYELDLQNNFIKKIEEEKKSFEEKINSLEENINKTENITVNSNSKSSVKKKVYDELKTKFDNLQKENGILKEDIDSEKNKYISLLHINQDMGNKIIENMKHLQENKSENVFLKNRVAELQQEKPTEITNDSEVNFDLDSMEEDKKKITEIKLNLEKINQEQNLKLVGLEQAIKERDLRIDNLTKELSLEKMENENLKEIQKSDIKNISKILTEQSSVNQIKKIEEYNNELKISLQNTNKINQELTNQKSNLEKELTENKNKLKEMQQSFLFMENNKDKESVNYFRDDKSNAAFSRMSGVSYMTHNKYIDSKIKDLEDTLYQEKNNSEKMVSIKQNLIDKLKKSSDMLTTERNKLYKELKETKLKLNTLQSEKNTLEESNEFLLEQVKDLDKEICDLKLNQEIYDQLEDKLEEYQRQFENLMSNNNNPQMQNTQFQQLINENVELNSIKSKFNELEKEIDIKNKENASLIEKITLMEKNIENIINENVNNNMMAANNHIKEIEEHLYHADLRIKFLDEENANLRKNIEDNKLIVFSLREKCKDMIAKEKEIFQLQATIQELKQKKNKRVSFGKDIVVEFQKENPYGEENNYDQYYNNNPQNNYNYNQYQYQYQNQQQGYYQNPNNVNTYMNQGNNYNYNNTNFDQGSNLNQNINNHGSYENNQVTNNYQNNKNENNNQEDNSLYGNRKISTGMDSNLQDLLKSQQSLYDKYSNQLNNIKKVQVPSIFDDIDNLINPDKNKNKNENDINKENSETKITTPKFKTNLHLPNKNNSMINLPMQNNSMILPSSKDQAENIGLNNEKVNNSLTQDVNDIVEKYNLSGYSERSNKKNFEKKNSTEVKSSMNVFDRILQENAIDLKDVDKESKSSKGNSPIKSEKIKDLIETDNVVDSIVVEIDVTSKTEEKEVEKKEDTQEKEEKEEKDENEEEEEI